MSRRARRITRRSPVRRPALRIVVAMEGASTEPGYLKSFCRVFGSKSVRLELIRGVGDPRAVVERAIKEIRNAASDPLGNQDSAWAMFDRDVHARFAEAKDMAHGNGVPLAVSNPCFELWGIFHYRDCDAPLERHACQKILEELCPEYVRRGSKVFGSLEVIEEKYADAVERARHSLAKREADGKPEGNPSTTVHELTEHIRLTVSRAEQGG